MRRVAAERPTARARTQALLDNFDVIDPALGGRDREAILSHDFEVKSKRFPDCCFRLRHCRTRGDAARQIRLGCVLAYTGSGEYVRELICSDKERDRLRTLLLVGASSPLPAVVADKAPAQSDTYFGSHSVQIDVFV